MSLRGFGGITTLGAAAQPVYGTVLTAAAVLNPDLFSGQIGTGGSRSSSVLSVTAGTAGKFRVGDRVAVGTALQFEQGNTTQADGGTVIAVSAANSTITVQGLQRAHASGEYVVLALPCAEFDVQFISASSNGAGTSVYLGEDGTAGAASPTLIQVLTTAGTFQYGTSNIANDFETQHLWVQGGAGSQYIPSFLTV
jgi:hypothetical protein